MTTKPAHGRPQLTAGQGRLGIHLSLDADLAAAIDQLATLEDRPKSRVIRELIKIGLAAKAKPSPPHSSPEGEA